MNFKEGLSALFRQLKNLEEGHAITVYKFQEKYGVSFFTPIF